MHFIANMVDFIFTLFIYSLISGLLDSQPRGWGFKFPPMQTFVSTLLHPNQLSYNEHIDRTLGRCGGEGEDWPQMMLRK